MSQTWFSSDWHVNHLKVAQLRGFSTTEDHNDWLIDTVIENIAPGDTLWLLGDLTIGSPTAEEYALKWIGDLKKYRKGFVDKPIRIEFVTGNHDSCGGHAREAHIRQREFLKVFDSVQHYARLKFAGQDFMLSHYPYKKDRGNMPRFVQYRLADLGEYLLHGHTHSEQKREGKELHVGIDAHRRPINIDEIFEMMRTSS